MPAVPYTRVSLSGGLGTEANPVDIFSFGFSFATGARAALTPAEITDLTNACTTFFAHPALKISQRAFLQEIKVSNKDATGHDAHLADRIVVANLRGGAGEAKYPYQIALAVSLQAATLTKITRGRFYLPTPAHDWDQATNQLTALQLSAMLPVINDFLGAAGQAVGGSACVASRTQGAPEVTDIKVGSILDTIRTRRNKARETYVTTPVSF